MEFCLPQFEAKVCASFAVVDGAFSAEGRSENSDLCVFWCE